MHGAHVGQEIINEVLDAAMTRLRLFSIVNSPIDLRCEYVMLRSDEQLASRYRWLDSCDDFNGPIEQHRATTLEARDAVHAMVYLVNARRRRSIAIKRQLRLESLGTTLDFEEGEVERLALGD